MLVLSRKKDQGIIIGENIELTIIEIQGDQVRIGIKAPRNVSIYRKEIFLEIQNENKKAASTGVVKLDDIIKKKD